MPGTFNSELQIVNRALQFLGAQRIISMNDKTPTAEEMSDSYRVTRDALIRTKDWSCCIKNGTAAYLGETDGRLKYKYKLPSDCLKVLIINGLITGYSGLSPNLTHQEIWDIQGDCLLTVFPRPLRLRYSFRNEDVKTYDALFCEVLALELAESVCERATDSEAAYSRILRRKEKKMQDALFANALERPGIPKPDGNWMAARQV